MPTEQQWGILPQHMRIRSNRHTGGMSSFQETYRQSVPLFKNKYAHIRSRYRQGSNIPEPILISKSVDPARKSRPPDTPAKPKPRGNPPTPTQPVYYHEIPGSLAKQRDDVLQYLQIYRCRSKPAQGLTGERLMRSINLNSHLVPQNAAKRAELRLMRPQDRPQSPEKKRETSWVKMAKAQRLQKQIKRKSEEQNSRKPVYRTVEQSPPRKSSSSDISVDCAAPTSFNTARPMSAHRPLAIMPKPPPPTARRLRRPMSAMPAVREERDEPMEDEVIRGAKSEIRVAARTRKRPARSAGKFQSYF